MQNISNAVMATRIEPNDSLDFFPTPPWSTRALCEWLYINNHNELKYNSVLEPACGQGHISRVLAEYFQSVESADIFDYGFGKIKDFLSVHPFIKDQRFDWIITNPPFNRAEEFAQRAHILSLSGFALIARTSFLESVGRYHSLFKINPPSDILQFTERVPMHKGRLLEKGSTATSYCWLVWRKGATSGTQFHWIEPCRKRLERKEDYQDWGTWAHGAQREIQANIS